MSQYLRIQIYNSAGTAIEYDNKTDTNWGITTGTAKLESIIMLEELKYGTVNASMFEVQIFGLNIDLSKRKIRVRMEYDTIDDGVIITDENKKLITDSGKHFKFVHVRAKTLFTGTIQSAKKNNANSQRDIVAYDRLYDDKQVNVAPFWESFWSGHETATIAQFRTALLNYMSIDYVAKTLPNDSVQITNTFAYEVTELSFDTLLRMLGELQAFCPHINGVGKLEFIQLNDDAPLDITDNSEGEKCYWEEYTTQTITGVAVYASSVELSQVVGNEGNLYNIVGNVLLLNMTGAEITTICNNLLTHLSTINYTPFYASLIISQPESNLGDKVITKYGDGYIMHSILSGPLLIDEYVDCKAQGPYLNTTATQINDRIIEANKRAVIEKTVDEFYVEYTDYVEDTTSTISQMSDKIVLKVNTDGQMVQVALTADPDTATTTFKVNADNINFIANGVMTLAANNIGIEATNFSIDKDTGLMNCVGGTIGGFIIDTNKLYNGVTSISDTAHDGVYLGTDGIVLGKGVFKVTTDGTLRCTNARIEGIENNYGYSLYPTELTFASGTEKIVIDRHGELHSYGTAGHDTSLHLQSGGIAMSNAQNTGTTKWAFRLVNGQLIIGHSTAANNVDAIYGKTLTISGSKSRVVETDDYGNRLLYCYETPTPMFGDVGEGIIAEDGKCYIWLDSVFAQTINSNSYQVFLQKYGQGECYIIERKANYFVVGGTPELAFGWELKAKQSNYEMNRLDKLPESLSISTDYGSLSAGHLDKIKREREVA